MKAKFSILLTVLSLLFGMSAQAQEVKGDVTGDKKVTEADIVEVVKIITGSSDNTNGDVTGDGHVNVADIVAIVTIMTTPPPVVDPKVNITIKNTTSADITISPKFGFFLNNKGSWKEIVGYFFAEGKGTETITAGGEKTYSDIVMEGSAQYLGLNFASKEMLDNANIPANNVTLYDANWVSTKIIPDMLAETEIFADGQNYTIVYSKELEPETPVTPETPDTPANPQTGDDHAVISFGVEITNTTGQDVVLNGELVFVLGNPNHNGKFFGSYQGPYLRTSHIRFSNSSVTLSAGQTRKFSGLTWRDSDTGLGMGEMSPANASQLAIANRKSNVLLYVTELDGTANSDIVICNSMDPNTIFRDGNTYPITIASAGINPGGSSPVSPQGGDHGVITFGVNITNAHGSPITLNGDVVFVLGNPNHNGRYFGAYKGPYLRTDHIYFSSPVTLPAGETRYFGGLYWRDGDTGLGMGEMSPANDSQLAIAQRRSNVLLYVKEPDGTANSEIVICDPMSPNEIFRNGETYNIIFR